MRNAKKYDHKPIAIMLGELHFQVERHDGHVYWLVVKGSIKRFNYYSKQIFFRDQQAKMITLVAGY